MTKQTSNVDTREEDLPDNFQWENRIPPNMSQEEYERHVMDKGMAAQRMLADTSFNFLYQEMVTEHVNGIINSHPAQKEERDDRYYQIRGLQDLMVKMQGWVSTAEMLSMRSEQPRNSIV